MSKCSKSKPKRRKVKPKDLYESLGPGQSEFVRKKLENIQYYQPLSPSDTKEKIRDLTDKSKLKDWFDNEEGAHTDNVSVWLRIPTPPRETSSTVSTAAGYDRGSTACCQRRRFEQFCEWGVNCEVSLKVNNTILKWDKTELVEPHLEDLFSSSYFNPASAASSRPETFDVFLGKTKKLNKLLEVIARYNERHSFHPSRRNSKTFVQEALTALGIACPPILLLFEDYREKIKSLRSQNVPEEFDSPLALTHYIKYNLTTISANPLDTEYIYFTCCHCHVTTKQRRGTTERELTSELEFSLQDLDSAMCQIQADLVFNKYWFQLSGLKL